jgi:hypothetical protein
MPAELVTGRARIAARALRRFVVGAIAIAAIALACGSGSVLIRPDADNPALAAFVEGYNATGPCDGLDPVYFGRSFFLMLLLAGVWVEVWASGKLQAWHLLRKAGGER